MRGYVGHAQYYNGKFTGWGVISKKRHNSDTHYLAVLPCSSRKQARALVRAHNTNPITREVMLANAIFRVAYFPQNNYQHRLVNAITQTLGLTDL